jgi:hypothetical protein
MDVVKVIEGAPKLRVIVRNNTGRLGSLTTGKEYEVLEETYDCYCIVDDNGITGYYSKDRFNIAPTHTITADQINQVLAEHPAAKEALKKLFPDVVKDGPEYFDFGHSFTMDFAQSDEKPIYIGKVLAPEEIRNKCIGIAYGWDIKIVEHEGNKFIIPFRKRNWRRK